jgi:hypothetical protein
VDVWYSVNNLCHPLTRKYKGRNFSRDLQKMMQRGTGEDER